MKVILERDNLYVIRFDRGEDVIENLIDFCNQKKIKGGHFNLIGASEEVVLSYYSLEKKEYLDRVFKENFEITGVVGNIAILDGQIIIHAHGTFSNKEFKTVGGHIKKIIISGTGEVVLETSKSGMVRKYNENNGLNLLD